MPPLRFIGNLLMQACLMSREIARGRMRQYIEALCSASLPAIETGMHPERLSPPDTLLEMDHQFTGEETINTRNTKIVGGNE